MKWMRFAVLCSLFSFGLTFNEALAQDEEALPDVESSPLLPPQFTAGALTTDAYNEGLVDVVLPLFFDGATLLFINPEPIAL